MIYLNAENSIMEANMTKEKTQRIHWLFSILLSIAIVVAGICLIVACVDIYNSGEQPFSREAVAKAFKPIAIPIYLCVSLTLLGFIWDFISPLCLTKTKSKKQYKLILEHLKAMRNISKCDANISNTLSDIEKKRTQANFLSTAIICIASVIFLIYACNTSNFDKTDINGSMIDAMWIMIPCVLVAFTCGLFSIINNEKSYKAQIELVKQIPITKKDNTEEHKNENIHNHSRKTTLIRIVILVVAITLIAIGYFFNGTADVLTKAINICTECIGLG